MPLISCEVSLELKWNKNCVITSLERRAIDENNPEMVLQQVQHLL